MRRAIHSRTFRLIYGSPKQGDYFGGVSSGLSSAHGTSLNSDVPLVVVDAAIPEGEKTYSILR